MRWQAVAEWVGFQLVWIVCALGAAQGRGAPGVLAAALFIAVVLAMRRWDRGACITVLISGVTGLVADSALAASGLVRFAAPWPSPHLAPVWIVALWLAFGPTLSVLRSWLGDRFQLKASILGLVSGPLSYWAGARLGALEIAGSAAVTYLAIAAIWAVALPWLLVMQERQRTSSQLSE